MKKTGLNKPFVSPLTNRTKKLIYSPSESPSTKSFSKTEEDEINILLKERDKLKAEIKTLNSRLSKLELIKTFKEKSNSSEFGDVDELIHKWKAVTQQLTPILLSRFKLRDPSVTTVQMLTAWYIPLQLVGYDEENDDFI